MSLTRIKQSFRAALESSVTPAEFDAYWLAFARSLVAAAGNESLWIPGSVPDPAAAQHQGDLFANAQASGMTIREIARAHKTPATSVHRALVFQRRVGIGTAA